MPCHYYDFTSTQYHWFFVNDRDSEETEGCDDLIVVTEREFRIVLFAFSHYSKVGIRLDSVSPRALSIHIGVRLMLHILDWAYKVFEMLAEA